MKPRLLRSDATAFDNLGFGALTHTISCIVKEELGVAPTLEMSLLNDDPNFVNVEVGNIIAVEPNKNDPIQAFVIEEITKPIDGIVTIYATHIAQHRGKLIPVKPFTASNLDDALSKMVTNSMETNPFTLVRDSGKNNVTATMSPTVPHSFRELMGGVEGSVLDTYRGEWAYDNFVCTLYNRRGRDNGARVMYGRNMSDFTLEEQFNWDGSATGVIGYWVGETGTVISDIQYSDYKDLYPYNKTVCMDFSDKFEEQPTKAQLNAYAVEWINGKGLYGASVDVAYEHINVEGGADIGLGDVVHIFNGTYNFEMESRIVGLEFDVLSEEYTNVTIGEQRTTLNEAIADIGGGATSSGGGGGGSSVDPSTTLPIMDGTASVGTEQTYARGDHVHPTDTTRLSVADALSTYTRIKGTRLTGNIPSGTSLADYCRTDNVPFGLSFWGIQGASDSPIPGIVGTALVYKPTSSGQYTIALAYLSRNIYMTNQLGTSGGFEWEQFQRRETSWTLLLANTNLPTTTATSYTLTQSWKNFRNLIIETGNYDNIWYQMMVDTGRFAHMSLGVRPEILAPNGGSRIDVYPNGDNAVYVRALAAMTNTTHFVRIWGEY